MSLFQESIKIRQNHLNLNNREMAEYLGVSINTLNKWLNGTREPNESVKSLLDLLEMVESWCPELHELLLPGSKT